MYSARSFPAVPLALGAGWLLFGLLVGLPLVTEAYHGEGAAWLNRLVAPLRQHDLARVRDVAWGLTWGGTLACGLFAALAYLLRTPRLARRLVPPATPGTVGALRALVCGVLLMNVLWEDLPSTAALPRAMVQSMGVIDLLYRVPGFEAFVTSPRALGVFQAFTALVLTLGLVGWRTRWTLPLGAAAYLVFAGLFRHYAWFYHTGLIPLYMLAVLAVLPSGDGFSVDRLRRLWRGASVPRADVPTRRYGWARYAVWVALALPYVAAGLSKLRNGGLFWWDAVNFRYVLLHSALHPMEFDFSAGLLATAAPDALIEAMALTALLGEICYGLVLVSRWGRLVLPTAMLAMHIGILALQNILFFDLIILQAVFFNLRPLRLGLGRWLNQRSGQLTLVFDGADPREARLARMVSSLDLLGRLRLVDRRAAEADDLPPTSASPRDMATPVAFDVRGEALRGRAAAWRVARKIPAFWLLLPLLAFWPFALWSWRRLGRPSPAPAGRVQAVARWATSPRLPLGLAGVMLFCWTFHVEHYPLTGMQMFSHTRGPVVTYEVTHAHLRDGSVVRTPIEASIGAMADGRFRRVLAMAFDPEREQVSRAFMETVIARWNAQAPPPRAIAYVSVERWRWNYQAAPYDPAHGVLVGRRIFYPDGHRQTLPLAAMSPPP
jgi:predicted DCC family thiol-disulfide oxidoreductase YuxK